MIDGIEGSKYAPVSLSGASAGEFTLPGGGIWTLQAAFYSNSGAHIHLRVERGSGLTAQTLATSTRALSQLGALEVRGVGDLYVYWFLCDSAGNAVTAGANDYILRSVDRR